MIHIERKEDCCGCTACESICGIRAIHLEPDEEGYLYPQFDLEKCIDCHLCEKVCPVLFRKQSRIQNAPLSIYATRQKDQIILKESSSGGIFTALAQYVLNKNGEMWVFGKDVKEREVYIKITLGYENGQTICISFHIAEHPLKYPFK